MLTIAEDASNVDDRITELIDNIKQIELPELIIAKTATTILVDAFDQSMNLIDYNVREAFLKENVSNETEYLTQPVLSTATIYGLLANVLMYEAEWIKPLEPNKYILQLKCNFGEKTYKHYVPPPRKIKKKKIIKERKKQGTGAEFNSQLTFVMNSNPDAYSDDDTIPTDILVFKIKVFRNGKVQLPGNHLAYVDALISSIKYIETTANYTFNSHILDISQLICTICICICMKNYKFEIKKTENQIIDLTQLELVFNNKKIISTLSTILINEVIYNTERSNLSVLFHTPTYLLPNKLLRLTIEKSGKVNIKGGLYIEYSTQVFLLLNDILKSYSNIIVHKYRVKPEPYNIFHDKSDEDVLAFFGF